VMILRTRPALGQVTVTWYISAVDGRSANQRFDRITGSVLFQQVWVMMCTLSAYFRISLNIVILTEVTAD